MLSTVLGIEGATKTRILPSWNSRSRGGEEKKTNIALSTVRIIWGMLRKLKGWGGRGRYSAHLRQAFQGCEGDAVMPELSLGGRVGVRQAEQPSKGIPGEGQKQARTKERRRKSCSTQCLAVPFA